MRKLTREQIECIRGNPENQDWIVLSYGYELPEEFIREFHIFVSWEDILEFQNLSEGFLIEFIDEVDICFLKYNRVVRQDIKDKIIAMKELMG